MHCISGISRSPAVVIAYLMRKNNWSYQKALQAVMRIRFCVNPIVNLARQLTEYEHILFSESKYMPDVSENGNIGKRKMPTEDFE